MGNGRFHFSRLAELGRNARSMPGEADTEEQPVLGQDERQFRPTLRRPGLNAIRPEFGQSFRSG